MKIASRKATDKHLKVYLSTEEYEAIKACATASEMSASLWAKIKLLQEVEAKAH